MGKRDYGFTLAEVGKGMWPGPVYEAHFANGTIRRMSFWSQDGKPYDFARGRKVCGLASGLPLHEPWSAIVAGYVERNGERVEDPSFNGLVNKPSLPQKRRKAKEIKTLEAALQTLVDKLPLCLTVEARNILSKAA